MSDDPCAHARHPHEIRDASLRVIGQTGACIAALIVIGLLVAWALGAAQPGDRRRAESQSFRYGPADVPEIAREWPAIEREWRQHLETYGWVDRRAGVVRIPIEQAMKRLADPSAPP